MGEAQRQIGSWNGVCTLARPLGRGLAWESALHPCTSTRSEGLSRLPSGDKPRASQGYRNRAFFPRNRGISA